MNDLALRFFGPIKTKVSSQTEAPRYLLGKGVRHHARNGKLHRSEVAFIREKALNCPADGSLTDLAKELQASHFPEIGLNAILEVLYNMTWRDPSYKCPPRKNRRHSKLRQSDVDRIRKYGLQYPSKSVLALARELQAVHFPEISCRTIEGVLYNCAWVDASYQRQRATALVEQNPWFCWVPTQYLWLVLVSWILLRWVDSSVGKSIGVKGLQCESC